MQVLNYGAKSTVCLVLNTKMRKEKPEALWSSFVVHICSVPTWRTWESEWSAIPFKTIASEGMHTDTCSVFHGELIQENWLEKLLVLYQKKSI